MRIQWPTITTFFKNTISRLDIVWTLQDFEAEAKKAIVCNIECLLQPISEK